MNARPVGAPGVRTLWLLRHAKTVADPPRGGSDIDRVLAPRGRKDAGDLGRLLDGRPGEAGVPDGLDGVPLPELALVSPARRTAATAEIMLAQLADPPEVRLVDDLYGAAPDDVLALLHGVSGETHSVIVVGHNPTVQALGLGLLAPEDEEGRSLAARQGFPTCALGVYLFEAAGWSDVQAEEATLVALLQPPY